MLTFWGTLTEEDISAYAGTLILPSFMAHLERSPFRFSEQKYGAGGSEPLRLSYTGEGRYEEFFLHPEKHALPLLKSICPNGNLKRIRFRDGEPRWRWSDDFRRSDHGSPCDDSESSVGGEDKPLLRVYFDPAHETLPDGLSRRFDPRQCHVSVTRMEIRISEEVIRNYISTWLSLLEHGEGNVAEGTMPESLLSTTPLTASLPEMEAVAGGFQFQSGKLGGEFTLQNDETFRDIFRYCSLAKILEELTPLVRPDLDSPETLVTSEGLRFRLRAVDSAAP